MKTNITWRSPQSYKPLHLVLGPQVKVWALLSALILSFADAKGRCAQLKKTKNRQQFQIILLLLGEYMFTAHFPCSQVAKKNRYKGLGQHFGKLSFSVFYNCIKLMLTVDQLDRDLCNGKTCVIHLYLSMIKSQVTVNLPSLKPTS